MKIAFFLNKKFEKHYNILAFMELYSRAINDGEIDIFYESNLPKEFISILNKNYDGLYTRHSMPEELIFTIRIPVFVQHEFPYKYIHKLTNKVIYLTDESYLKHCPVAEIQPMVVDFTYGKILEERKYDIAFLGRYGLRKNELGKYNLIYKYFLQKILKYVNCFYSSDEVVNKIKDNFFLKMLNLNNFDFYWHLIHGLRNRRRDIVVKQLYKLADDGYKVCMIVDLPTKNRLLEHRNIEFFYELDYEEINTKFSNTKISIVSTPLHTSTYNERFISAMNTGTIPIVEPYAHYNYFFKSFKMNYFFDYSQDSLYNKTVYILSNLNSFEESRKDIAKRCDDILSSRVLIKVFEKYIKKYKKS